MKISIWCLLVAGAFILNLASCRKKLADVKKKNNTVSFRIQANNGSYIEEFKVGYTDRKNNTTYSTFDWYSDFSSEKEIANVTLSRGDHYYFSVIPPDPYITFTMTVYVNDHIYKILNVASSITNYSYIISGILETEYK